MTMQVKKGVRLNDVEVNENSVYTFFVDTDKKLFALIPIEGITETKHCKAQKLIDEGYLCYIK